MDVIESGAKFAVLGVLCLLASVFGITLGYWPTRFLGLGLLLAGAGFSVPRVYALFFWEECRGTVLSVAKHFDHEVLKFRYDFHGKPFYGEASMDGGRFIGQELRLRVNPSNPVQFVEARMDVFLVSVPLMLVGVAIGLGLIAPSGTP